MQRLFVPFVGLVAALAVACGPAQQPTAQQPAKPAAPQQAAPAPQPAKPAAEPAKPAAQPAKPAAEPAKPAAQPAKPAAASGQKQRILYGSSSAGSSYYVHSVAVAKLWNTKVPEVEVTNVEAGGCSDHLARMSRGEMHAGVSCPDLTFRAWQGIEEYKDKGSQVQRFLYIHSAGPQAITVRKDTNITKLEDLNGKDFTAGMKGSATEKQVLNIFTVLDIKPKYYNAGVQDMIQAAKDRRIVGFTKLQAGAKNIDAGTQEVHVTAPLYMLGFTPEHEKKIVEKYPYYSFLTVEKDALAPGFPSEPTRAVALIVGVSLHKDISADIAYKLTKVSIEDNIAGKGEGIQSGAYPAVKGVDFVPLSLDTVMTPFHAGAAKYYKEIGKELKKEQIPPEAS